MGAGPVGRVVVRRGLRGLVAARRPSRSFATAAIHEHVMKVPTSAWTAAVETDGEARDRACVAELTGKLLDG